jgi:hypothetical protein
VTWTPRSLRDDERPSWTALRVELFAMWEYVNGAMEAFLAVDYGNPLAESDLNDYLDLVWPQVEKLGDAWDADVEATKKGPPQ